jgi:hypothetical protein
MRDGEHLDPLGRIEKMLQLARAEAALGLARVKTDLVAVIRLLAEDYAKSRQIRSEDA